MQVFNKVMWSLSSCFFFGLIESARGVKDVNVGVIYFLVYIILTLEYPESKKE